MNPFNQNNFAFAFAGDVAPSRSDEKQSYPWVNYKKLKEVLTWPFGSKKSSAPAATSQPVNAAPPPTASAPAVSDAGKQAKLAAKRRRGMSQSIFAGETGGQQDVIQKSLLGQ